MRFLLLFIAAAMLGWAGIATCEESKMANGMTDQEIVDRSLMVPYEALVSVTVLRICDRNISDMMDSLWDGDEWLMSWNPDLFDPHYSQEVKRHLLEWAFGLRPELRYEKCDPVYKSVRRSSVGRLIDWLNGKSTQAGDKR